MKQEDKRISLFRILVSGLRHRYLVYFRPRYTIESLLKRKNGCKSCGRCCQLNMYWCRYFVDGKCEIYDRQPFFCRIFPIDEKDKRMSGVSDSCGYSWD